MLIGIVIAVLHLLSTGRPRAAHNPLRTKAGPCIKMFVAQRYNETPQDKPK